MAYKNICTQILCTQTLRLSIYIYVKIIHQWYVNFDILHFDEIYQMINIEFLQAIFLYFISNYKNIGKNHRTPLVLKDQYLKFDCFLRIIWLTS